MRPTLFAVFVALVAAAPAQPQSRIDRVLSELRGEVRPGEAMDRMYRVYSTDRWFTFPKFQETAEYVKSAMTAAGMSDVELVSPPADGVTQYGWWTMPLAWDVRNATLELVEPTRRVLCDYQEFPASLGMWSGPTPPEGITAEVVDVRSLNPADVAKLDLKGKFALVHQTTYTAKLPLVRAGAIGVINASTENEELRDGHWWMNYWGDSGWGYTKKSTPLVSFSVTPRQGEALVNMLARGKVRVHAKADSRYYVGAYPYATGVVKGTSDEEVLELGHTTEIGANDNATGIAIMIEAAAALNRLIEGGKLSRPRRSIRLLAMPELYGSMHYITQNPGRIKRTVAAICLDTPAGPYGMAGTEYTFVLNPDVSRSYTDALILRIGESYFTGRRAERRWWHWSPYMTGTDTFLGDPMIGVPTVWPYGGAGINTHHNSEDIPDKVDARSMRDATILTAAYLYLIASASEAEVPWLAEITGTRGIENVLRAAGVALDRLNAGRAAKPQLLYDGLERIKYTADREEEAIHTTLRLAAPDRRESLHATLAPTVQMIRRFAAEQSERLSQTAGVKPVAPADSQLAQGARMVVTRKRMGGVTLDDLPTDQWEGYPSAAWDVVAITALNWCDGKRDLAEVIRRTRIEHGAADFDFVGYFRFLARHGYVDLAEK